MQYETHQSLTDQGIQYAVDFDAIFSLGMEWEENRPKTYKSGRKCRVCGKPLNSYNPGPECLVQKKRRRVSSAADAHDKITDTVKNQAALWANYLEQNNPVEEDLCLGRVKMYPKKIERARELGYESVCEMYKELYKIHDSVAYVLKAANVGSYGALCEYYKKMGFAIHRGARRGNTNQSYKGIKRQNKVKTAAERHKLWLYKNNPVEDDKCLGIVVNYAKKLQIAREMGYDSLKDMVCDLYAKHQSLRVMAGYGVGSHRVIAGYLDRAGSEIKRGARIGNTNGHRKEL